MFGISVLVIPKILKIRIYNKVAKCIFTKMFHTKLADDDDERDGQPGRADARARRHARGDRGL